MDRTKLFLLADALLASAVVLASCAPGPAPTLSSPPSAPTVKAAGAAPKAPAPSPKPGAEQPRYGGILTISLSDDPPTLDPQQETTLATHVPVAPSYSGLLQYDPLSNDKIIGDLADTWEISKDGLAYTFHLRKDVKFHDGSTLRAEDVKFSLERAYDAPRGVLMPRKDIYDQVLKIEAPDDLTVKITMKAAQYVFLSQLARGENVIHSKGFTEAKGHMKADVMGTGPFRLKGFSAGSQLEVVKFPNYFVKGRPYLDGITFFIIPDAATRFAAFRTGRIWLTSPTGAVLTPSEGAAVESQMKGRAVAKRFISLAWHELLFNFTRGPTADVRVRQAISLAIDRQKAVEVSLEGSGRVGGVMLPGSEWAIPQEELLKMPGYRQPKDGDIAESKRLLAEAGYPTGFETAWPVRRGREFENTAVFLKDQLAKIGIVAKLQILDYSIWLDTRRQGAWDMLPGSAALRIADPDEATVRSATGNAFNFGKFSDQKVDELNRKQASTMDAAGRQGISFELQRRILETSPKAVVAWIDRWVGYWLTVKNFQPGIGQFNNNKHANVWLAE
ncbi:MAG: hypothetical protein HYX92_15910 [Chloroflexi bacterium]|nr:hypothetical protein [Chloroflexota bacterium]